MQAEYRMTREEAAKKMEILREVFDGVRLLDEEDLKEQGHGICVEAYHEKRQKSKLEFLNSEIYQVTARYVEIAGQPYVMELVKCMDEDVAIDEESRRLLVGRFEEYTEILYKDVQTGVFNRRYYEDKIKNMQDSAGVAVIDLDDFKLYNDTYGHSAGDVALTTAADVIRKCVRKTDILIRYGGDEFLLVLPGVNEEILDKKLRQIQTQIANTSVPGYSRIQLSVSIGGVVYKKGSMEEAICRADKLMYRAKTQKNMVVTELDAAGAAKGSLSEQDREKIKQQILIVDDSEMNRAILAEMLHKDFQILEAEDGEQCLAQLQQYGTGISLILLDIVMPGMDGFEVLSVMERNHWIEDIPVIMISSEDSETYIRHAYEMGVSDYISRPFDAKVVYQRVFNTIKLYAKQRRLTSLVSDQMYEKEKNNRIMISILSQIVEFRNGESGLHVLHISELTRMLLECLIQKTDQYPLSWQERYLIETASALHDIGKIGIDDAILNKPGRLTPEEFEIMKSHTVIGAGMLENLEMYRDEPLVKTAHEICRWHHERYDGKGYPDGLVGDAIPISAQVVSVADVYDALTSKRVYKDAYSHEQAMNMILNGECGSFNPILLECLKEIQDKNDFE